MKPELKNNYAKSEKRIYDFVDRAFGWLDKVFIQNAARLLQRWQSTVSVRTRNFWIIAVLGLIFLAGLYNLFVFILTFTQ